MTTVWQHFNTLPLSKEFDKLLTKKSECDQDNDCMRIMLTDEQVNKFNAQLTILHDNNLAIIHHSGNYAMIRYNGNWRNLLNHINVSGVR